MNAEEKNFPASELKLQKLRTQGQVPFSRDMMTFAVLLGLFIALWVVVALSVDDLVTFTQSTFSPAATSGNGESLSSSLLVERVGEGFQILLKAIVMPLLALIFLVLLLGGLLQTRFLFHPGLMRLDFSRLFNFPAIDLGSFIRKAFLGCVQVVKVFAWMLVSYFILRYVFSKMFSSSSLLEDVEIFVQTTEEATRLPSDVLAFLVGEAKNELLRFFSYALGFSMFVAIVSRFVSVLIFHRTHRMTRTEVEAEYREMESSPEFRNAQRELSSE